MVLKCMTCFGSFCCYRLPCGRNTTILPCLPRRMHTVFIEGSANKLGLVLQKRWTAG